MKRKEVFPLQEGRALRQGLLFEDKGKGQTVR